MDKKYIGPINSLARRSAVQAVEDLKNLLPQRSFKLMQERKSNNETKSLLAYLSVHLRILEATRIDASETLDEEVEKMVKAYNQHRDLIEGFYAKELTSDELELALRKLADVPLALAAKITIGAVKGKLRLPEAYKKFITNL